MLFKIRMDGMCFISLFERQHETSDVLLRREELGQATLWRKEKKTARSPGSNQGFSRRGGGQYGERQTKEETSLRSRDWGAAAGKKRTNGCSHTHDMRSVFLRSKQDHTKLVPLQEDSELTESKHENKGTYSKGTAVGWDWSVSWLSRFEYSLF